MTGTPEALVLQLSADVSRLEKQMARAVKTVDGSSKTMERRAKVANDNIGKSFSRGIGSAASDQMNSLAGRAGVASTALSGFGAAGLAASAAIGTLVGALAAGKQALAFADELGDAAQRIGVTTDTLQEFRYAVSQTGGEAADADAALQGFTEALGKARTGLGKGQGKAFAALGLDPKQLGDADDAIKVVIDRLSKLGDESERQAIAAKLGLTPMVGLLREGAGAAEALREQAHKLGYVMDADLIAKAGEANDKMEALNQVLKVQLASTFVALAPIILQVAEALNTAAKALAHFAADPTTLRGLQLIGGYLGAVGKGGAIGGAKYVFEHRNDINETARMQGVDWSKFESPQRGTKVPGAGGTRAIAPPPKASGGGRTRSAGHLDSGPTPEELARTRDIAALRERIEIAREANDAAALRALDDQLDRLTKIADYRKDGLDLAQATAKADSFLANRDLARQAGAIRDNANPDGFTSTADRVGQLNEDFSAGKDLAAQYQIDFRTAVHDGFLEALQGGDLKSAFRNFISDLGAQAAENLASMLTDALFSASKGLGGSGGLGSLLSSAGSLFSGGFGGGGGGADISQLAGLYANGTDSAAGGLSLVGERGPELLNLPRGAQVIPNDILRGLSKSGGQSPSQAYSPTLNLHVYPQGGMSGADARRTGSQVGSAAMREMAKARKAGL